MSNIRLLPGFNTKLKKFARRNTARAEAVADAFRKFRTNPAHPSLHLEKLTGSDIWTIRIDQGNRLFFTWSDKGDTAIFFFVGPHDSYKTIS